MDVSEDDLIAEAITEAFGERCPDFEPDCFCCKVWKQYDELKARADDNGVGDMTLVFASKQQRHGNG